MMKIDENHENCGKIMKVMEDDETKKIISIALINKKLVEGRVSNSTACVFGFKKKRGVEGGRSPPCQGGWGGVSPPHLLLLLVLFYYHHY